MRLGPVIAGMLVVALLVPLGPLGSAKTQPVAPAEGVPDPTLHDGTLWAVANFASPAQVPADAALLARGLTVLHRYSAIPAVAVAGPLKALDGLRALPGAVSLVHDEAMQWHMETATVATQAIDVWGDTWRSDYTNPVARPKITVNGDVIDGTGVLAGVIDSGANALHPDLMYAALPTAGDDPLPPPKILACVSTIPGVANVDNPYCDQTVGHGTHVAGILAGNGYAWRQTLANGNLAAPVGVAPGAQLLVAGLGAGINLLDVTVAMDWMYDNADADPANPLRVINNSYGNPGDCDGTFVPDTTTKGLIDALVDGKGVVMVFSAGNYDTFGNPTSTSLTASYSRPGVISVANYNDLGDGTRAGSITSGSSDGCPDEIWTYPDVAAPGNSILSTTSYTGTLNYLDPMVPPFYGFMGGTSMAAPHVAGIVALMLDANPDLTPAEVERILIETATPWLDTLSEGPQAGSAQGWGSNAAAGAFTNPAACAINPANFASHDHASDLDESLYVCRDVKRGRGLVDAYAAVQRAISGTGGGGGGGGGGTPELTITSPTAGATLQPGQVTLAGQVNRAAGGGATNQPPTASLSGTPLTGAPPLAVTFTLGGSDPDGAIASWSLDYGDSSNEGATGAPPASKSHTYAAAGTYNAVLTVTDDKGAQDTHQVTVVAATGPPPMPCIDDAEDDSLLATADYELVRMCARKVGTDLVVELYPSEMVMDAAGGLEAPVAFDVFVNGLNPYEAAFFGGTFNVWNFNDAEGDTNAVAAYDTAAGAVVLSLPVAEVGNGPWDVAGATYLGEGFTLGWGTLAGTPAEGANELDRVPDDGQHTFSAVPRLPGQGLNAGPQATDPAGDGCPHGNAVINDGALDLVGGAMCDAGASQPWLDVRSVEIRAETATTFDVALGLEDLADLPTNPYVTTPDPTGILGDGQAGLAFSHSVEFCTDSAKATYTGGNHAGGGYVCYRFSAAHGPQGDVFASYYIAANGSGCGYSGPLVAAGTAFDIDGDEVVWRITKSELNYGTIGPTVQECADGTRNGSGVRNGDKATRLMGYAGANAFAGYAGLNLAGAGDTTDPADADPYTFGGVVTPPSLTVEAAGPYSGLVGQAVAIAATPNGGTPPTSCSWSGPAGATFANANACVTTVSFGAAGVHTVTVTATDSASPAQTAQDTAPVSIAAGAVERVELLLDGSPQQVAVLPVSTSASNPTATWSTTAPIAAGAHTLTAIWMDVTGAVLDTKTRSFTVATSNGGGNNGGGNGNYNPPPNQPPTASLQASPLSGCAPLATTFTMAAADADGPVSSWSFDASSDGTPEAQGFGEPPATFGHTYTQPGSAVASLRVLDARGAVAVAQATLQAGAPCSSAGTSTSSTSSGSASGSGSASASSSSSASSAPSGSSGCSGAGCMAPRRESPPVPSPERVRGDSGKVEVEVEPAPDGTGALVRWTLPATDYTVAGVQLWRLDGAPKLVAELAASSSAFQLGRFQDAMGTPEDTYVVTLYAQADIGRYRLPDAPVALNVENAGKASEDAPGAAIGLLLAALGALALARRRKLT